MLGRLGITAALAALALGFCAGQSQAHGHGRVVVRYHGGYGGYHHAYYHHAYYYPRVYASFGFDCYRPHYYSYYYYRPCYYPPVYYYSAPIVDYRISVTSIPTVAPVIADPPAPYRSLQPIRVTPVPVGGDGTFPYDGGPVSPVPQPKGPDLTPSTTPKPSTPVDGKLVSLSPSSKTSQYAYPAYGDDVAKKSVRTVSGK
jgi:hypothetical protein